MKALVITKKNRVKRFLVEIHTDSLVQEIAALIGRKRYSEAVAAVLAKGRIEKEIAESDVKYVKADLLLSEDSVNRDLTSKGQKKC